MEINLLRFPHKQIRAQVIKEYIADRHDKAVCFSCGNAAVQLERAGVKTLHIGAQGALSPRKWFTQAEIHDTFPNHFDATSGHLPTELMVLLADAYKKHLRQLPKVVYVPTGSGETLVCLKLAFPDTDFIAVYNLDDATEYNAECPLNPFVRAMAKSIIYSGRKVINGKTTEGN